MIDPTTCTNHEMNDYQLEEFLFFSILVAGKTARIVARSLQRLLDWKADVTYRDKYAGYNFSPVNLLWELKENLPTVLRSVGIGCYNLKARGLRAAMEAIRSGQLNLRTCTPEDLQRIPGIGPKTARFFIIHSRANARYAALDTHILKFLRAKGIDAPKSTPTGKRYKELEQEFLELVPVDMTVAEFDLAIWNHYTKVPYVKTT